MTDSVGTAQIGMGDGAATVEHHTTTPDAPQPQQGGGYDVQAPEGSSEAVAAAYKFVNEHRLERQQHPENFALAKQMRHALDVMGGDKPQPWLLDSTQPKPGLIGASNDWHDELAAQAAKGFNYEKVVASAQMRGVEVEKARDTVALGEAIGLDSSSMKALIDVAVKVGDNLRMNAEYFDMSKSPDGYLRLDNLDAEQRQAFFEKLGETYPGGLEKWMQRGDAVVECLKKETSKETGANVWATIEKYNLQNVVAFLKPEVINTLYFHFMRQGKIPPE